MRSSKVINLSNSLSAVAKIRTLADVIDKDWAAENMSSLYDKKGKKILVSVNCIFKPHKEFGFIKRVKFTT